MLTWNVIWSDTGVALPVPVITIDGVSAASVAGSAVSAEPVSAAARVDESPPADPTAYASSKAAATPITITNVRTSVVARAGLSASSFGAFICPLPRSVVTDGTGGVAARFPQRRVDLNRLDRRETLDQREVRV
jgi:hypothetical protein